MKRIPLYVIGVLAQAISAQNASVQNGGLSLSGRVVNRVSKAGIPGVTLEFCRIGPPRPNSDGLILGCEPVDVSAVTDDTGFYRVTGLPEGQYAPMLTSIPDGFFPPFPVTPAVTVAGDTRADLELTPATSVSGHVYGPDGNPAVGVVVALDSAGCNRCTARAVKITNAEGEFAFTDIAPTGSVILSAAAKFQDTQDDEKTVTTYYPSAIDRDLAERIEPQGTDLIGYDIKLRKVPAHSVRGIVLDAAGNPVPKALVSIVKPSMATVVAVRGVFGNPPLETPIAEPVETIADGTFKFPPVMRGDWTLRVANTAGLPTQAGSAEVSVGDADVESVTVRIAPALNLEIQTDFGDSPPAKLPTISVFGISVFMPLDTPQVLPPPPPPPVNRPPAEIPPFNGFTGKYLIEPPSVGGYYLAQALISNRDTLGQVTDIAPGDAIKLVFRKDGGSVRGTVDQGGGASGTGAMVVLMADPSSTARLGYSGRCDANGAFVVADVPPGDYIAVAGRPLPDFASSNFGAILASSGKRVRVEAGSTAQVDLRLAVQ